jgi:hypothetical protein
MTPESIELISLIGLRALADYDLAEFARVTDMSKRQLDERIERGLTVLRPLDEHPITREAQARFEELREIEGESQTHTELNFLLRQLSQSCLQRAQQLALAYSRTAAPRQRPSSSIVDSVMPAPFESRLHVESEYLRLAVMRLIRDLPEYVAMFNYRIKNREVDCFLVSRAVDTPAIIVEAKRTINSRRHFEDAVRQLKQVAAGWGKSAIFVIVTTAILREAMQGATLKGPVHVLVYDTEHDEFVGEGAQRLVAVVHGAAGRA